MMKAMLLQAIPSDPASKIVHYGNYRSRECPSEEFALHDALTSLSGIEVETERLVESGENVMPLLWARGAPT
jgi:hypothetical protein